MKFSLRNHVVEASVSPPRTPRYKKVREFEYEVNGVSKNVFILPVQN